MRGVDSPIDVTDTLAWTELEGYLKKTRGMTLRERFASDAHRAERYTFDVADLHLDLSKNLMDDRVVELLYDMAEQVHLPERRDAMLEGAHVNTTEDRAVLHTALRLPASECGTLIVDGQDVVSDVHDMLDRMFAFANKVRSGSWTGVTGKRIKAVVNIGIGGSHLGPEMVYEALRPYADDGIEARFVSNVEPNDLILKLQDLDPETTMFIVASKTFSTLETLVNAREARAWLLEGLAARGVVVEREEQVREAIRHHFVAVSTALDKVCEFGIDPANAFGFWDWVGGRYSVDSAVGLVLVVALGPNRFKEMLRGFYRVDRYFVDTPLRENAVVLLGMLNILYSNFYHAATHAILPYDQRLSRFAAYMQQLMMESNGKSVRWDGTPVTTTTGEVFWGEPGTNGQHAFYQLMHQGTQLIPADFIAFVNAPHIATVEGQDVQELLLSNFLAQTKALAFGKTAEEVRADGVPEATVPMRVFAGNKPTTSIMADSLTPKVLGELIALYEHVAFVEGTIWGIDSYDQWGVELGKQLATEIAPAFHDSERQKMQDGSTFALIEYCKQHRRMA